MLYPYTHQFILFDDIKEVLTGFGRFTYYRCFSKNELGEFDPSFSDAKGNWLMNIKEGEFKQGKADGYQRQLSAYNSHCKQGYFKNDQPYGKFVEYDKTGKEWYPEGYYLSEKECVKRENFESFEENIAPNTLTKMVAEEDYIPVNYHLKRQGDSLRNPNSTGMSSVALSGVSNMTAKEIKIEEEYEIMLQR